MTAQIVHLELPDAWRRLAIAADGDRAGQRALLLARRQQPADEQEVTRLVRASRQASRAGVGFAAVLLAGDPGEPPLTASLTVGFRRLPGAADARIAAEGVLSGLRHGQRTRPTRRLTLMGLGGDPHRPAVLLRDRAHQDGVQLCLAEVLWLVPGTEQLAVLAVTSPDLALADGFAATALDAAQALVLRPAPRVQVANG